MLKPACAERQEPILVLGDPAFSLVAKRFNRTTDRAGRLLVFNERYGDMEIRDSLPESAHHRADCPAWTNRDLGVGIGIHQLHYPDFLASRQPVDWVEVHTEDYLADGGYDLHVLEQVRRDYPLSFHGAGLSIGSTGPLDKNHVGHIASLVERFQPALVSEHLSWSVSLTRHLYDALPLPFTAESLDVVARHVDQIQSALKRTLLVENITRGVCFRQDEMTESEFLSELVGRTGCAILVDISNLYESQTQRGDDAFEALARLPADAVMEIHVSARQRRTHSVADHYADGVCTDVWRLYGSAVERFGGVSTLIECEGDAASLSSLLNEASTARHVAEVFGVRRAE
ncbi:DUF692 domain-containing protein [Burkholderia latens]|nr:DUF692 domain-containing protein [Burkholderia latens]